MAANLCVNRSDDMNMYDKSGVYVSNGEDFNFKFKTTLCASEKVYFVNSVTDLLIGENYNSVLRNLVFDFFVIDVFTDVDTSWIYIVEDDNDSDVNILGEMESFVYNTNIVDIVRANDEYGVIDELMESLDLNIEYRTGIHKSPIIESIANLINAFERKVNDFDVDAESLIGMVNMLGGISGELTADKLLEAYAKSDIYKSKGK